LIKNRSQIAAANAKDGADDEEKSMPLVSVVTPTYNRADSLGRAIESVINQTLTDWELIVVDDGSTDSTTELVTQRYARDPRVKLIRQENQGVSGARNTGLHVSAGKYIAFLDSDDEYLPHHLELEAAFLESHPEENFVSAELWEDFGHGAFVKHYQIEIGTWYPEVARLIGSRDLDLPAGETDDYMRVYQTREPIGEWGRKIVERLPYENARLYRGNIYERLRWGYLLCAQPSMITRRALSEVGKFDPRVYAAQDFGFMAEFCRRYTANYLSIPVCIKHELGPGGRALTEGHISTGATADLMSKDLIDYMEKLFYNRRPDDRELSRLLAWRQYQYAHVAISLGRRDEAVRCLEEARRKFPDFWHAALFYYAVKLVPQTGALQKAYQTARVLNALAGRMLHSEMTVGQLARKLARRFNATLLGAIPILLNCADFISYLDSQPFA
jgi:glycosyltransferase involved in cell wall biosynthesis